MVAGHRAHSGALQVEASKTVGALLQYLTCPLSKQMLWAWHRASSRVHAPNTLVFLIMPLLRRLLLIRKARAFLLYSSHLEELTRQLPAAWELPLLQPIISLIACVSVPTGQGCVVLEPPPVVLSVQLKRCFCLQWFGFSQYGLLISINWWETNPCLSFTALTLESLTQQGPEFVLLVQLDVQSDGKPPGERIWAKENRVCLSDVLCCVKIRWLFPSHISWL